MDRDPAGYLVGMDLEPTTPDTTSPVIDLTAGFDVAGVDHPYDAAELVLGAA